MFSPIGLYALFSRFDQRLATARPCSRLREKQFYLSFLRQNV